MRQLLILATMLATPGFVCAQNTQAPTASTPAEGRAKLLAADTDRRQVEQGGMACGGAA